MASVLLLLLPYTPSHAARKLGDDVCKSIASPAPPPTYTLYSYPSHWPLQADRNARQGAVAVSSPEWQEEMLRDPGLHCRSQLLAVAQCLPFNRLQSKYLTAGSR